MPSDAAERWLAISAQFPIGPKRPGATLRSTPPADKVSAGQLRQASWQDADAVVLIESVDEDAARARIFPVSLEPGVGDARAVIIEPEASPLHGGLAVWPGQAEWIPYAALDQVIAVAAPAVLRAVRDAPTTPPRLSGVHTRESDPPPGSGATLAIDEMFDAIEFLQHAPTVTASSASPRPRPLEIPLQQIIDTLRVPQPRAMAIRLGKEPLSIEEAEQLASAANVPAEMILAALSPLPWDLLRELHEPRWRAIIRERATDNDETHARTRLGYEAYQLAARESGTGRDLWRQRIAAVLAREGKQ
ncbi:hypothetical protein [Microbacterium immunditiarum]|uniref:Uncharacterized protein n=1 Tax=Microbacterium immunditiarum TaxID=337480 RepID=A0A7Y9GKD0_9MICO|nr:hypothetical protein [Microbacterium immunditiarum]NYE18103.1 hypothetical protein [Microbacterium immunditiarum]